MCIVWQLVSNWSTGHNMAIVQEHEWMKAERKFTKCKAPTTTCLAEKLCAICNNNPQIYRTKNTTPNENMPNITQVLRNIIINFNNIYYLQTTYRIPTKPQLKAFTGTKLMRMAGRPTNQHTKDLRAETCATKRSSDSSANPAFHLSLGSVAP